MKHKNQIPMPSEQEKQTAVHTIISQGMPPSTAAVLMGLWRALGLRGILYGIGDCMVLGLLAGAACWLALVYQLLAGACWLPATLVAAPASYAFLFQLAYYKESQLGTQEIKMVCRYTLRHLAAFRLLLFGGIAAVLCCVLSGVIGLFLPLRFGQAAVITLAALALYGAAHLAVLMHCPNLWMKNAFPAFWAAGCLLLGLYAPIAVWLETLFSQTPVILWALLLCGILLYFKQISALAASRAEGESVYASS